MIGISKKLDIIKYEKIMKNKLVYGKAPEQLAVIDVEPTEYMNCKYLPVSLKGSLEFEFPENLKWMRQLFIPIINDMPLKDKYVYVTAKYMYVSGNTANRPGWHSDGFGTNDINYIWYDSGPTEFCIQDFNLSDDHIKSMDEMTEQAKDENIVTYPNKTVLKLTPSSIHRVGDCKPGFRTFVKISISNDVYNLKGNAINPKLHLTNQYYDRDILRNDPSRAQLDYLNLHDTLRNGFTNKSIMVFGHSGVGKSFAEKISMDNFFKQLKEAS